MGLDPEKCAAPCSIKQAADCSFSEASPRQQNELPQELGTFPSKWQAHFFGLPSLTQQCVCIPKQTTPLHTLFPLGIGEEIKCMTDIDPSLTTRLEDEGGTRMYME